MEILLENVNVFKNLFTSITDFENEVSMEFNYHGVTIKGTTIFHNFCVVEAYLSRDAFTMYQLIEPITLRFQVYSFLKILQCVDADDFLRMKYSFGEDEGKEDSASENHKLNFYVESSEHKPIMIEFHVSRCISSSSIDIPRTEYDSIIHILSSTFQKAVEYMSSHGQVVKIKSSVDTVEKSMLLQFVIIEKSVEMQKISYSTVCENKLLKSENGCRINCIQHIRDFDQDFSVLYLQYVTVFTYVSPTVVLYMKKDHPLMIEYMINDSYSLEKNSKPLGYIRYRLARNSKEVGSDEKYKTQNIN